VMNSFGKRNTCSQWEGPSMHSRHLAFIPFKFFGEGERGKRIFFHFSLVPNVFPLCSFQLLNGFSSGSQYVPQVLNMFPNMSSTAPQFYPICFGKCCPPFTYIMWAKGEELYTSKYNLLFQGVSIVSVFLSDGSIKLAHCWKKKKKKNYLRGTSSNSRYE